MERLCGKEHDKSANTEAHGTWGTRGMHSRSRCADREATLHYDNSTLSSQSVKSSVSCGPKDSSCEAGRMRSTAVPSRQMTHFYCCFPPRAQLSHNSTIAPSCVISLSLVSVTLSQQQFETTKWEIPEILHKF